jgi:serine/threonine protein kinase
MSRYTIADCYEVFLDQPLKDFENESVRAYACRDNRQPELPLVCLKASVFPQPRMHLLEKFHSLSKAMPSVPFMNLQYYGNDYLSSAKDSKSIILIYQRPKGERLIHNLGERFTPWSEEEVIDKLIKPAYEVINALQYKGLTHQSISPFNMYISPDEKMQRVKIGDCLAVPAGLYQHPFFEPINYAMAEPIGKGEASSTNDLFALGASVAYMLNGGFPSHLDLSKVMAQRLDQGTLTFYLPKGLQNGRLYELLRGLLHDNEEHRWAVHEVGQWLTAGRQASPMSHPPRRASRPLSFNGKDDIYTINSLFVEMYNSPMNALEMIHKNELSMWLKNGLSDNHRIHQLDDLNTVLGNEASGAERLMGVFQILLPGTPFFWQGKFYTPNGLGVAFADAVIRNDNVESLSLLLSSSILPYYLTTDSPPETANNDDSHSPNQNKAMLTAKSFINYYGVGGGVERAMYYMCPSLPCLSPIIRNHNVISITELLYALDEVGRRSNKPELPLDNHIIAYIFSKESALKQSILQNLSSPSKHKKIRGALRLFSELQTKNRLKTLTGLCRWFGDLSESVIDGFKNIKYQEILRKKLQASIDSGDLSGLIKLLDNKKAIEMDANGLKAATSEVRHIEKTVKAIIQLSDMPNHYSERIGQNNAMMIAAALSFAASGIYIFIKATL